jgi:hypothetical protein
MQWVAVSVFSLATLIFGVMWLGIRTEYRTEWRMNEKFSQSIFARLSLLGDLTTKWWSQDLEGGLSDVDFFVERLWAVFYPALAVQRVPDIIPYENGRIFGAAVRHVLTPRVLFPSKPPLESDSEKVRRYSGVWVAGAEDDVSIAFGYAGEAYVDFGIPLMFLPSLAYAILMGMVHAYARFTLRNREVLLAFVTAVFWISLYLFERSWAITLGLSGTLIGYLGGIAFIADRYFGERSSQAQLSRFARR